MGFGAKLSTASSGKFNAAVSARVLSGIQLISPIEILNPVLNGVLSFTYGDYKNNFGVDANIFSLANGFPKPIFSTSIYGTIRLSERNYLTMEGTILHQSNTEIPTGLSSSLLKFNHVRNQISFSGGFTLVNVQELKVLFPLPIFSIRVPFGKKIKGKK